MHLKLWNYWICIIYYIYNMIKNPDANQSQILLIPGSHRWPLQYVYRSQLYQFRTPTPQIWVTTGGNATSLHNRINDGWGTSEKRPKIGGNCQLNKFYPVIKHTLMDMIDNCRMKNTSIYDGCLIAVIDCVFFFQMLSTSLTDMENQPNM